MMCHIYSQHTVEVTTDTFTDWVTAPCPLCQEEDLKRVSMGKRSHGCGFLRPKVYLYGPGELCLDEKEVLSNFNCDLREPVDAVLIVGTRLQIPDLKTFAQRLCKQTRRRKGIVAWINKESPKLGTSFESLLDFQLIGDCDDFASSFLE